MVKGFIGKVGFGQRQTVDIDLTVVDGNNIPRQADYPFNKPTAGVGWEVEDDNIAAVYFMPAIGKPVHDDKLAVMQAGFHTDAFNPDAGCYQVNREEEHQGYERGLK